MLHSQSGERIEVHTEGDGGPYVMVPPDQLDDLRDLLNRNRVGHSVDDAGIQMDGQTVENVVNLGGGADAERVQQILDSVD